MEKELLSKNEIVSSNANNGDKYNEINKVQDITENVHDRDLTSNRAEHDFLKLNSRSLSSAEISNVLSIIEDLVDQAFFVVGYTAILLSPGIAYYLFFKCFCPSYYEDYTPINGNDVEMGGMSRQTDIDNSYFEYYQWER